MLNNIILLRPADYVLNLLPRVRHIQMATYKVRKVGVSIPQKVE